MATKIEKKQNELAREVSCSIKLMAKQGEGLKQYYRVYFRSFYTRLVSEGHVLDLFAFALDQEVVDAKNYRGASRVARPQCKCIKREAIVGPAVDKDVAHEDVGLKTAVLIPKEIPVIRKNNPVLQIKIAPRQIQNEEKDADTLKESEEPVKKNLNPKLYATLEELEKEKLPPEEILSLPMFKVGVAEMKVVIERTGGLVILAESFSHSVFKDSFRHVFEDGEQYLGLSFK